MDFKALGSTLAHLSPQTLHDRVDKLIVDADGLCYFCAGSADTSPGQSLMNVEDKLRAVEAVAGVRATLVCTAGNSPKGGRYFQASIKPYQGNRSSGGKPKNWEFLRARMLAGAFGRELLVETYAEADDLCASMAGPRVALHYQDKDFRMLPGWHITWKDYALIYVKPEEFYLEHNKLVYGEAWFWLQMLHGDSADNIPGLERYQGRPVGPVAASRILCGANDGHLAAALVGAAYADTYPDNYYDRLLEQAQLLWLRRNVLDDLDVIRPGRPLHRFPHFREMHEATK